VDAVYVRHRRTVSGKESLGQIQARYRQGVRLKAYSTQVCLQESLSRGEGIAQGVFDGVANHFGIVGAKEFL
jgi:hypothetical protein